jgi:hypothetical protein
MKELNKRIANIPIPPRIRGLPLSDEGYPIPYFVPFIDGKADFRAMDGEKLSRCVRFKRCWLCGQSLGKFMVFVAGPMCAVNRNSAEPPSHRSCAEYAVLACPFLTQPRMRRNEKDLPEGSSSGIMLKRNPGVAALWITQEYKLRRVAGTLFALGNPIEVKFYCEGRAATRAEILESIDSGMPLLMEHAIDDGSEAVKELDEMYKTALTLLPKQ